MKHNTVFLIAILCLFIVGTVSADTLNLSSASAGSVGRTTAGTFTAIRNGAGTFVDTGSTAYTQLDTNSESSFSANYRYSIQFNTSALPDDCTITNVSVDIAGNSKSNTFSTSPGYGITRFSPATNGSLASSDYNKFNDSRFATDIPYASIDTSDRYGYNRWYFNSLGISNVSKTGFTNIMVRLSWDIDNSSPTAAASKTSYWEEHSTDTLRSVINITYTPAAGGDTTPPASITGLANTTTCNSINFTWTNPTTSDFNGTMNWLNGTVQANMTNTTTFKLVSGLTENLAVTLGTKTYDFTGNVNATFTNMTATTYTSVAANFTKNQTAGVQPLSLIFNDTSTGTTLTGWNWSFGDTTWQNGTTRNASKIYSSGGTYSVFLIGTNPCGSNTSATQTINIYNQTSGVSITPSPASGLAGTAIQLTPSGTNATKYNWFFPNGTSNLNVTSAVINTFFASGGTYSVRLNVTDGGYGGTQVNATINVYNQTTANFTPAASTVYIPPTQSVTFTYDGANATWYNWSFGNGTWYNTTSSAAIVGVYSTVGNTTVNLTTSNNGYGSSTAYGYVNVLQETTPPASITGLANTTTCNSVNWTWTEPADADFNHTVVYQNGTWFNNLTNTTEFSLWEGLAEFTEHTFSSFTVDTTGNENTTWVNQTARTLNCTPVAGFSSEPPTEGNAPLTVQFFDGSTGTIHIWNWSFGDGDYSGEENPSHQYTTPGTYDVNLTVSNDNGEDFEIKIGYVIVHNTTPVANFTADITSGCVPQTVQFNDTSTGVVFNWSWKLNGVEFSTEQNATYEFTAPGLYEWVNLTVMNDGGADTYSWQDSFYFTDCSPNSITGLTDDTTTCEQIIWNWTNPSNANFNHTYVMQDGVFDQNVSNASHSVTWTGLTGGTAYSINTSTVSILGNMSATWVNDTATTTVCVVAPVANFTVDNTSVCLGSPFQFNDTSTNIPTVWYWMFGDTGTSAVQNASHVYDNTGTYSVYLNASNSAGFNWSNKTNLVTVNDCTPPASISNLVGNLDNCTQINWTWTNPTDADYNGSMVYQDGVWLHNVTNTTSFDVWSGLTASTSYIFSARSFDITGNLNTTWVNVTKSTDACPTYPPVAQFSADNVSVCTYETIQFTDSSENATAWWWLFGDSQDSHIEDPTHFYDTVGVFNVSLRATNADGEDWENKTNYITVSDCSPPASITGLDHTNENCYNITWVWTNPLDPDYDHLMIYQNGVWLHNITTPTATDIWEGLSTLTNYTFSSHTVDATGNVNQTWVNLTGNTSYCVADTVASFTSNVTCGIIPFAAQYNDTSIGTNITAWFWDFGDGVNSTEQNPIINYTVTGIYGVDHSATGDTGTNWSNISGYMTARPLGDTCLGGGDNYDSDDYAGNWFTSWWF